MNFLLNDADKEYLDGEYVRPQFEKDSGLSFQELEEGVKELEKKFACSPVSVRRTKEMAYLLQNMRVSVNEHDYFADIFEHGNLLEKIRNEYSWSVDEELGEFDCFAREARQSTAYFGGLDVGHVSPDWDRVLSLGFAGIYRLAKEYLNRAEKAEQKEFYSSVVEVYGGVIELIKRFSLAAKEKGGARMEFLSERLVALTERAPKDLYEALQTMLLYFALETDLEAHYLRTMGNLEQLLKPFYENDLSSGNYTEEELDSMIAAFYLKLNGRKITANVPFSLGGYDREGNSAFSYFSEKLVDIYSSLGIFCPKLHIKYAENLPDSFGEKVCKEIIKGNSSYLFINDKLVQEGLKKMGNRKEDCRDYLVIGCYEPVAARSEVCATCTGQISYPKVLELTLNDGFDPVIGKQMGLHTGSAEYFTSFEKLLDAYLKQLDYAIRKTLEICVTFEKYYEEFSYAPLLSATFESCIKRGKEAYRGGIEHPNSGINAIGIATAIDSLCCIKQFVYEKGMVELKELVRLLNANWDGGEKLRLKMKKYAVKYGNGIAEADELMKKIFDFSARNINGQPNGKGGVFRFGLFSVDWYMYGGEALGATADGRYRGEFISKNAVASLGQDTRGVTALMDSLKKLDYSDCINGSVLDFLLHPSAVKGKDGAKILYSLIKTYLDGGGFSAQGNVFDDVVLKKAQKEPDKYKNLQVRVCGWNAYFTSLSSAEQDVFIEQTQNAKN